MSGNNDILTIGHSTRSIEEFTALLAEHDVQRVVDIRSIPGSRHVPHFNGERMAAWLPEHGVAYSHIGALGGRRSRQPDVPKLANAGWRLASFRNYADYCLSESFHDGVAELEMLAFGARCAIMCSEAVPWRCHRNVLSNVLVARGFDVAHIVGTNKLVPHELGMWGPTPVIGEYGDLHYPLDAAVST